MDLDTLERRLYTLPSPPSDVTPALALTRAVGVWVRSGEWVYLDALGEPVPQVALGTGAGYIACALLGAGEGGLVGWATYGNSSLRTTAKPIPGYTDRWHLSRVTYAGGYHNWVPGVLGSKVSDWNLGMMAWVGRQVAVAGEALAIATGNADRRGQWAVKAIYVLDCFRMQMEAQGGGDGWLEESYNLAKEDWINWMREVGEA